LLQFKAFKSTSISLNLKYRDQRNHNLETADCTVSKEWVACFLGLFSLAKPEIFHRKIDKKPQQRQ
jgi:hypothetical protein